MVMEASPSPQSVGREFVRQYYTLLNKAPAHLHRFYNNYSSFVHGGLDAPNRETLPVVGQKQIHNRIQQLNFRDCHAKISQVDAQATLGNGVVVQVTGELSNGGAPMRRFTQTFVLAAQSPKKYYVHNDIFRYQDIVFSDEEGEGSGRSEGEDEEAGPAGAGGAAGYFPAPPPASAFPPAAFPAPPPAPHLNGHPHALGLAPQALAAPGLAAPGLAAPGLAAPGLAAPAPPAPTPEDSTRHLVAALQAHSLSESESEPAAATSPPAPVQAAGQAGPVGPGTAGPGGPGPAGPGVAGPVTETGAVVAEPDPAPEPEREPSPPPHPPAAPEPKTYANLLKSGSGSTAAPARCSPPAAAPGPPAPGPTPGPAPGPTPGPTPAPHEPRPRPPRAPHAAPAHAAPPPAEGTRRYSDAQQLFLGNLPHCATEEELRALFARFGPVAELRVHSKPALPGAPRHPNYGFITYETSQAAHDCLNAAPLYFPGASAEGVKLNVEEKKARAREPPRRRPLSSHRAAFAPRQPYRR